MGAANKIPVRLNPKHAAWPAKLEFPNIAKPAPFVLRPFAGIYNPFPYGCSVLCNHPADYEAKDVVKRAKDAWASDGKALLLPEELACLRGSYRDGEDAVPEELFRRYTDTDSRPPTPAPTLASAAGVRRRHCLTPDPLVDAGGCGRARPTLVLDLRRSHSQDAVAWRGGPVAAASPAPSPQLRRRPAGKRKPAATPAPRDQEDPVVDTHAGQKLQQQVLHGVKALSASEATDTAVTTGGSGDEEVSKRRGRRRKRGRKSGRDGALEPEKEFQGLPEPGETQVSTLDPDSHNPSARPSLAAVPHDEGHKQSAASSIPECRPPCDARESFLDRDTLRHLQRELDQEVVESEFNHKKHLVLKEALRMASGRRKAAPSEEMRQLKKELGASSAGGHSELLLGVPRNFSRQSARFELPMDSRALETMKPIEYVEKHVLISSGSLLLYNRVFNRHKEELDEDESERKILGKSMIPALGEVMGRPLSDDEARLFRALLGWGDADLLGFRSWAGACALCERLFGSPQDCCCEVERADFESLPRRLAGLRLDPALRDVLSRIRDL
ncbi:uncharacterized protein LOC134527719 isoform X2 [Bacillus rossius redtenbacheri]|uniref:uncharacterized protein LOC134527719 isoform X2 n=1 Tax=Bacillus rossius redtenbacheri TaxID=93214 RepID=UPI002FDD51A3